MLFIESGDVTNPLVTTAEYNKALREEVSYETEECQQFNLDFFRLSKELGLDWSSEVRLANLSIFGSKYLAVNEGINLLTSTSEILIATKPVNISAHETKFLIESSANFAFTAFEKIDDTLITHLETTYQVFTNEMLISAIAHVSNLLLNKSSASSC